MRPTLQVGLDVRGRPCVVVGGNDAAEERVVRLLEAQAQVTLIAPQVTEALHRWADAGKIRWHARAYSAADLADAAGIDRPAVVLVCELDDSLAAAVQQDAEARGILYYAQDRPERSRLSMPALVRRGSLRLAISTGESSPALAGRLRADLERIFDEAFVHFLVWLDELRTRLREEEADAGRRADRLREAVDGFHLNAVLHYPEAFRLVMPSPPKPPSPPDSTDA
jgi:siroheme synthase-like protein